MIGTPLTWFWQREALRKFFAQLIGRLKITLFRPLQITSRRSVCICAPPPINSQRSLRPRQWSLSWSPKRRRSPTLEGARDLAAAALLARQEKSASAARHANGSGQRRGTPRRKVDLFGPADVLIVTD